MSEQNGAERQEQAAGSQSGARPDLMRDWISLWQSELSAMATDREAQDQWQRILRSWTKTMPPNINPGAPHDPIAAAGAAAGAAASAWAAAFAHASDARNAALERLAARISELEQRIAALEGRS